VSTGLPTFLSPSFLSAFQLGLQNPEFGPIVPLSNDPANAITQGSLVHNVDQFLPIATALAQEQTSDAYPKEVGEPDEFNLRWLIGDSMPYEKVFADLLYYQQRRDRRLGKTINLRVNPLDQILDVSVGYADQKSQITQQTKVSRDKKQDFTRINLSMALVLVDSFLSWTYGGILLAGANVHHDILYSLWVSKLLFGDSSLILEDLDKSIDGIPIQHRIPTGADPIDFLKKIDMRGGLSIVSAQKVSIGMPLHWYARTLVPEFSVSYQTTDTSRDSGVLGISFAKKEADLPFPSSLVSLLKGVKNEIERCIRIHQNDALFAPEFIAQEIN